MSETHPDGENGRLSRALAQLREGKLLLARRTLAATQARELVENPEVLRLLDVMWVADLSLRHLVAVEFRSFPRPDDLHLTPWLFADQYRRLLLARREDLASHAGQVSTALDPGVGPSALLPLSGEEYEVRKALRRMAAGWPEPAGRHFALALASTAIRLRRMEGDALKTDPDTHEDLRELARFGRRIEAKVWGTGPMDGLLDAAPELLPTLERIADLGVEPLLIDRRLEPDRRFAGRGASPPEDDGGPARGGARGNRGAGDGVGRENRTKSGGGASRGSRSMNPGLGRDFSHLKGTNAGLPGWFNHPRPVVPPPADVPTRVQRTPHMDLSVPAPLAPGTRLEVSVYADEEAARAGEEVRPVEVEIPPHLEFVDIGVTLVPSDHFVLEGPPRRTLRIARARPDTDRATFQLRLLGEGELRSANLADPGTGVLTAVFDDRGRPAGRVTRHVEIGVAPPAAPPAGGTAGDLEAAAPVAALPESGVLSVHPDAELPDIMVDVVPHENNSGREFRVRVVAPHARVPGDERYDPWNLPQATSALVQAHMKEFTHADAVARVAALRGAGKLFWNAAPENFKRAYWRLMEAGTPPASVSLVSVEPHIPWELMIPHRGSGATSVQMQPLGVSTRIGRWTRTDGVSAEQRIALVDSRVIAPVYTSRPLKHAREEAALVTSHFSGSVITPGDLRTITRELGAAEDLSLLHLVCHGSTAGAFQTLKLEGDYELSTTVATGLQELEALFGRRRTLVFLNACEVGRTTAGLVGVEGFANAFIQMGAVAVIAPLWAVRDSIAYEVAKAVYNGIRADPSRPFAAIFQEIRRRAYDREMGEDTYAAYCFYGDPLARMA